MAKIKNKTYNNIGIIVQARMSSTRLPGKVMLKLANKEVLWHVVKRCQKSKLVDTVIVATSSDPSDDRIEKFCKKNKFSFYRGSLEDVLDRYYNAAKKSNLNIVVRITADCPLTDPDIIDDCINSFKKAKCDYISNVVPGERTFPRGLDVEVFSFKALKKAHQKATQGYEKEHATSYIWENKNDEFVIGTIVTATPKYKRNYRLTVDYPEDFLVIKKIYQKFGTNGKFVSVPEALLYLDSHPKIVAINADCEQRHNVHAPVNLLQKSIKPK